MRKNVREKIDGSSSNWYFYAINFKFIHNSMRERESYKNSLGHQNRVSAVQNLSRRTFLKRTGAASMAVVIAQASVWENAIGGDNEWTEVSVSDDCHPVWTYDEIITLAIANAIGQGYKASEIPSPAQIRVSQGWPAAGGQVEGTLTMTVKWEEKTYDSSGPTRMRKVEWKYSGNIISDNLEVVAAGPGGPWTSDGLFAYGIVTNGGYPEDNFTVYFSDNIIDVMNGSNTDGIASGPVPNTERYLATCGTLHTLNPDIPQRLYTNNETELNAFTFTHQTLSMSLWFSMQFRVDANHPLITVNFVAAYTRESDIFSLTVQR